MTVTATEFKAKCLALIDRAHKRGETIVITKRGRVVAKLIGDSGTSKQPWKELRGQVTWYGDPLAPALDPDDIEVYK